MTRKFGWTNNVLIHQIENQSYEKTLLNQTNFNKSVLENIRLQAKLAVKDKYTLRSPKPANFKLNEPRLKKKFDLPYL
jgi:predicted nuclease of restriction endonuclease-like (RecB) superfamily